MHNLKRYLSLIVEGGTFIFLCGIQEIVPF